MCVPLLHICTYYVVRHSSCNKINTNALDERQIKYNLFLLSIIIFTFFSVCVFIYTCGLSSTDGIPYCFEGWWFFIVLYIQMSSRNVLRNILTIIFELKARELQIHWNKGVREMISLLLWRDIFYAYENKYVSISLSVF